MRALPRSARARPPASPGCRRRGRPRNRGPAAPPERTRHRALRRSPSGPPRCDLPWRPSPPPIRPQQDRSRPARRRQRVSAFQPEHGDVQVDVSAEKRGGKSALPGHDDLHALDGRQPASASGSTARCRLATARPFPMSTPDPVSSASPLVILRSWPRTPRSAWAAVAPRPRASARRRRGRDRAAPGRSRNRAAQEVTSCAVRRAPTTEVPG